MAAAEKGSTNALCTVLGKSTASHAPAAPPHVGALVVKHVALMTAGQLRVQGEHERRPSGGGLWRAALESAVP